MMEDSLAEDRHSPGPGPGPSLPGPGPDAGHHPVRQLLPVLHAEPDRRRRAARTSTGRSTRRSSTTSGGRPQIRDVLISGGDGLTLAPKLLESVLRGLREIPHVEIVRIGSRVPVFLPQRIDDELCEMLARYHPVWLNIHVNHPNEITPELARACDTLARAGIPLGNQSVLLAGVNDCVHIQRDLVQRLVEIRVRPYYLYQCDLVEGAGHFRTPVGKGLEIIEGLRGHTSGYAVPQYIVDAPGGGGKIPVMPNYLISLLGPQGRAPQLRGLHHHLRGADLLHAARLGDLPLLPEPAPGAGPGRDHRAPRRQADVDRAGRLHRDARPRQRGGAPPPGPLQVGAVRRRRARGPGGPAAAALLEAGTTRAGRGPARSRARPTGCRPRPPTTSCCSRVAEPGHGLPGAAGRVSRRPACTSTSSARSAAWSCVSELAPIPPGPSVAKSSGTRKFTPWARATVTSGVRPACQISWPFGVSQRSVPIVTADPSESG